MHGWSGSLLASLLAAAALSPAPPGAADEQVELEVAGVLPLEEESGSLLVLRDKGVGTFLPIFVGRTEGAALGARLRRGVPSPRPGTADLLERAIAALGGRVARVAIEGEQAPLLRGRVLVAQGERRVELEARPSDAVALAVAARAPIFATRRVLSEAGLSRDDLARLRRGRARPADGAAGQKLSF